MNLTEVRKAIVDWVRKETGFSETNVIWAEQNMPRPVLPYVSLRMDSFVNLNREYITGPDSDGMGSIINHKEFTLHIHHFISSGFEALSLLINLHESTFKVKTQLDFENASLVFVKALMGPTDTTIALDGVNFEKRGSMDLKFRMPWIIEDADQGNIEAANVSGDIFNG